MPVVQVAPLRRFVMAARGHSYPTQGPVRMGSGCKWPLGNPGPCRPMRSESSWRALLPHLVERLVSILQLQGTHGKPLLVGACPMAPPGGQAQSV